MRNNNILLSYDFLTLLGVEVIIYCHVCILKSGEGCGHMCFEAKSLELAGSCQQIITFVEQRNDYVTASWADTFLTFGFHGLF